MRNLKRWAVKRFDPYMRFGDPGASDSFLYFLWLQAETRCEFAEKTVAKLEKTIDEIEGKDLHTPDSLTDLFLPGNGLVLTIHSVVTCRESIRFGILWSHLVFRILSDVLCSKLISPEYICFVTAS